MQCVDARGEGARCWQSPILGVPVETGWTEQWVQVGAAMVLSQKRQLSLLLQERCGTWKYSVIWRSHVSCYNLQLTFTVQ